VKGCLWGVSRYAALAYSARNRVDEMLAEHRAEIEKQLGRMDTAIAMVGRLRIVRGGGSVLKGRRVTGLNY
jgi:hypothetical protein